MALISLIIFIIYNLSIIKVFGIPESISATSYLLKEKNNYLYSLFTIFCWSTAFTLIPDWMEISKENLQFLVFLSISGLGFVGATPLFRLKPDSIIHYISAVITGVASHLWIILSGYWEVSLISILSFIIICFIDTFRNYMYWIEVTTSLGLYYVILN